MPLRSDYDSSTAIRMEAELKQFAGDCWYDEATSRIVFRSSASAMRAYMAMQVEEMKKHKWLESEKARRDLNGVALTDWVRRHSEAFAQYWQRTHEFVPRTPTGRMPTEPKQG